MSTRRTCSGKKLPAPQFCGAGVISGLIPVSRAGAMVFMPGLRGASMAGRTAPFLPGAGVTADASAAPPFFDDVPDSQCEQNNQDCRNNDCRRMRGQPFKHTKHLLTLIVLQALMPQLRLLQQRAVFSSAGWDGRAYRAFLPAERMRLQPIQRPRPQIRLHR